MAVMLLGRCRNCNHFSDELCSRLVGVGIPSYLNRLAWLGTIFNCFVPQRYGLNRKQAHSLLIGWLID